MNERAASFSDCLTSDPGPGAPRDQGSQVLGLLGDRHLLFSEARQAIFELDDVAAHVWRSLDDGMTAGAIVRDMTDRGYDRDQAARSVDLAIAGLRSMAGAASPSTPRSVASPSERLARRTILVAGVAVHLYLPPLLLGDVDAVFGHLLGKAPDADDVLCASVVGTTVTVASPRHPDWSCERSHFIPSLKAQLIDTVLHTARYEVALHAAALVRDDSAVLLVGSPGAGKSTLAIALARSGYRVLADDVCLLDDHGRVTGISLPFTAKASGWPLLSRIWPGITDHPSHRRPDGQTLCYIPLDPVADPRPRRIGAVVLLDRHDDARTAVEQLDLTRALAALVAEGATRDERLSASGFTALVDGLRHARCCRLTYSDLMEAAAAVSSFHP